MLEITVIKSGLAATRYYTATTDVSNYYVHEQGIWGGKGAAILRLDGQVKREQFLALAKNLHPHTGERLTVRTQKNRRIGYDFCWDVPKSISIYLAETGDQKVESLILETFKEIMSGVEWLMETRVSHDKDRLTGNMIYSAFVHRVTRPMNGYSDPHFHVHGFIHNATFDVAEFRWKAAQFGRIVSFAPSLQKAFNESLMAKMAGAGFDIRRTKDAFELAHITRDLIERFSKRARIIKDAARAFTNKVGSEFSKVKKHFARSTREKKSTSKLTQSEQLAHWRSQMTPMERAQIRGIQPKVKQRIEPEISLGRERKQERIIER